MTSNHQLMPCPFCGKPAREQFNWPKHFGCSDPNCGAYYAALSLDQWNRRPAVETFCKPPKAGK